jgi:hypothetical protein
MAPSAAVLRRACVAVLLAALGGPAAGQPPAATRPLPLVPAGTPVGDRDAARWNRLILAAAPRIAAGDTTAVAQAVRDRLGQFTLVVLATVRPIAGPDGGPRHRIDEVGVGYAVPVAGVLTVVDTDNPPAAAGIDFLGRQILAQNGKGLEGLRAAGESETVQVFDAESLLVRDGRHADFLTRHFVWVDPASGDCSACVWLLARRTDGSLAVADDPPRWIAPGTREDRVIHVDADEFLLGVPTKRAFALVDLPPGQPLAWSPALRAAAAERRYDPAAVRGLAIEVDRSLGPLRARR